MTAPTVFAFGGNMLSTSGATWAQSLSMAAANASTSGGTPNYNQCVIPGTLSNLTARAEANGRTVNTTLTVYQNGSPSSLSVTMLAGTTSIVQDTTDTVTLAATDTWGALFSNGTGTGSLTGFSATAQFLGTSVTANVLSAFLAAGIAGAVSTTGTIPASGNITGFAGTERNIQSVIPVAGTLGNLQISVSANTLTSNKNFKSRIGPVGTFGTGNQTATMLAGTTGQFTDTTNTDAITAGWVIDIAPIAVAGSGAFTLNASGYTFEATAANTSIVVLAASGGAGGLSTGTRYFNSYGAPFNGLETPCQQHFGVAATLSNGTVYVSANASTANATIVSRINGVTGNQAISVTASTTGAFSDPTNTDTVGATDLFCWQISGHNGSVGYQTNAVALLTSGSGPPPPTLTFICTMPMLGV